MVPEFRKEENTGSRPRSVLFLCTGNSARSQMAEGFAQKMFPAGIKIYSAGITPVGVNPITVEVMKECEIDIRFQYSKGLSEIPLDQIDTLITLCGYAQSFCPTLPRPVTQEHWPIEDPVGVRGTPEEKKIAFRNARDEIRVRLVKFLQKLGELA